MAPVFLARVLNHHDDLTPATQGGQGLYHLHGQVGNTEHHNARRQTFWFQSFRLLNLVHELRMHVGPGKALRGKLGGLRLQHILLKLLPQMCLPNLVERHDFALSFVSQYILAIAPIGEPIGAVALVTIKNVGHLLCQLIPLTPMWIVFDVSQQRRNLVRLSKLGQQAPQAPNQSLFVKGHRYWHHRLAQYQTVHAPNKARRQFHLRGCANAHGAVVCQGHFKPVLHAIALHQQGFWHQGGQGLAAKQAKREIAQVF